MAERILARDGIWVLRLARLQQDVSLRCCASALAILAVTLALNVAPAWADGGNGSGVGAGQGGVDGALAGATGQNVPNGATAGGGGGGVDLTTGNGAPGGSGSGSSTANNPNGVAGATGATGLVISTDGTIATSISGGAGASGSPGTNSVVRSGGGGGGGVGVSATADVTVTGTGSVVGGTGGRGGNSGNSGSGGGGVGIFSSANVVVEAGGSVTGGTSGSTVGAQAGGGGGAAAIVLIGGGTIQNSGNLLGGAGGRALLGGGGDGGAAVLLLSGGTVINNQGATIIGGSGGQGSLAGGDGAAGIKGANIAVINAGTITGGAVGAGGGTPVAGRAIQFTGGVNSLEIQAGSNITGNVVAFSNADTFKLGGDTNASFDVSQIGAGAKYDSFGLYEKTGRSTWTLTGTTTALTPWSLSSGTLQISSDNNLGASGGLTFNGGTLQTTADITSGRTIALTGGGTFLTDVGTTLTLSNVISGAGALTKAGGGTMVLSGANTYTGGTVINNGTLQVGDGGSIVGNVLDDSTLAFNRSDALIVGGAISGSGAVVQQGSGSTTLTGLNSYSGGTVITGGTLIGQASSLGTGGILNDEALVFDQPTDATFAGSIDGSGSLTKQGLGNLSLTGTSTLSGPTTVEAGKLVVEGSLGSSQTTVNSGATLGGSGSIGGAVIIADGGMLAPGSSPGTLTVGSLSLSSGSILDYELGQAGIVGGGVNDLIEVTGNLTLDGSLNITDVGGFGPGVYRLINYGGALTDNGLELGNLPAGVTTADLTVQTSVANQVNLVSSVGNDLLFWDGDAVGNANNNLVDGGNGTWTATSLNWTTSTGLVTGAMKPQPGFAIFQTLGGTVTADDSAGELAVTGMQFAADGYRIVGDAITVAGAGGESIIRVGDGTLAGAGYTATIASVLTGASSLTKTDAGTLVLSGANTYTGGTIVSGGVLSVSADNNLGDAAGDLTLSGGTLRNTAVFSSARDVTLLPAGGTFDTVADLALSGAISGAGSLAKTGAGTLTLTGTNNYGGNTLVSAGTLVGNAASIRGDIGNAGTVVFDQTGTASFAGDISGTGTMVKDGAGTLTLAGTSLLDWTIDQGGLVSAAERFGGDVSIGAGNSFTFDQVANASYAGVLSGAGTFIKDGQGTLVLASDNSGFTGATSVSGGTLAAGAENAFSSSSQFSVASGATLDLAGTSQTIAGLTNAGTVGIAGSLGSKLTVSGDYVGNGGNILIGTALGADNSQTNMLVIAGDTSGTGTLQVVNLGGGGAQTIEGIKIVDVGGVSNGSFSLKGNYTFEGDQAVVGGAYAYRVYQGGVSTPGDGDWYLRSALLDGDGPGTPLYQAGAPLYEAYSGTLQSFNQLGTLQQRLGNRSWTIEAQGADGVSDDVKAEAGIGLWGRIEGTSGSYDPESSTTATTYDTSTWRLQTGADMLLSDSAAGQLIGGVAFQYGTVSADVSSVFGSGSIDSTGTGVSGSLTWYGAEGFYLDGQAQVIWYDSNLDSATAGQRLVDGNNGVGYALGVEAGKRIMLDPNWSLTPQAQLAWSSVDLDAFTDAFGARVTPGTNDSLLGRLGLSLDHQTQWQDRTGRAGHTNLYGIANLYYDFEDGSSVDLAGSTLSNRNEQLWGGLGIGGTINWADDRFSVFGEAIARTGLEDFGDSHVLTGSLGLRVKW
ncbi:autotransporter outer membrane beta-barrel domain-containing protein [Mesorhizobium sp. M0243]|uniref:autotransporter outer membrane beta-barrel domain-containing protein n=1 Tax=Mesorhizobium sp. M0243 TaxID=2956925 RepID=UPI0033359AEB